MDNQPLAPRSVKTPRNPPSVLLVNTYLVVGIALLILASAQDLPVLGRYAVGAAVELVLAGLALVAIRIEGLDIRTTARLRTIEPRSILLALGAMPGLWLAGVVLNLLSSLILGYSSPVLPSQFPATVPEAIALAITTVVVAPICEEIMFRGYVQRSYERWGPGPGVGLSTLVFALYHLRFQGAPALIPVAAGLAFFTWRSDSIVPSIVLHAVYNAVATVLLVALSFGPPALAGGLTAAAVCAGALAVPVSVGSLWVLWHQTDPPPHVRGVKPAAWKRLAAAVPALGLILVYGYAALSEVIVGAAPGMLSSGPLRLSEDTALWQGERSWHYDVRNALGVSVGRAACTQTAGAGIYSLACESDYDGWDSLAGLPALTADWQALPDPLTRSIGRLQGEARTWRLTAQWDADGLQTRRVELQIADGDAEPFLIDWRAVQGQASLLVDGKAVELPPDLVDSQVLLPYEWAWRLSALPFEMAYSGQAVRVSLADGGAPLVNQGLVSVVGGEPVWTPAGTLVTWKVVLDSRNESTRAQTITAWYAVDAPHPLVKLDDGAVVYLLEPAAPSDGE